MPLGFLCQKIICEAYLKTREKKKVVSFNNRNLSIYPDNTLLIYLSITAFLRLVIICTVFLNLSLAISLFLLHDCRNLCFLPNKLPTSLVLFCINISTNLLILVVLANGLTSQGDKLILGEISGYCLLLSGETFAQELQLPASCPPNRYSKSCRPVY